MVDFLNPRESSVAHALSFVSSRLDLPSCAAGDVQRMRSSTRLFLPKSRVMGTELKALGSFSRRAET